MAKKKNKKNRNLKKKGSKAKDSSLQGSQRPIGEFDSSMRRRYDLEILENPVREPYMARQLIELREHSYIVSACLSYVQRDCFSSSDGDDRGFTIGNYLSDGETPINEQVKDIALDLFSRRNYDHMTLGGNRLQKAIAETIVYGDCFFEIGIAKEGIGRNDYGIADSLYLPTWEMFKKQDDRGVTQGYEQRRTISDSDPDYFFYPHQIIHFQHNQNRIYGRSLWHTREQLTAWSKTKDAVDDLAKAARDLGQNPNIHTLPEGTTKEKMKQYKDAHRRHSADSIITNYYLYPNTKIEKMAGANPSLTPLAENLLQKRVELIPPGFPLYYFPELSRKMTGSREISNQPALNYARIRHSWCAILAEGIKKALDVELVLKLGYDRYMELLKEYRGQMYVIQFPRWETLAYTDSSSDESESPYEDLEQSSNQQSAISNQLHVIGYG